MVEGRVVGIQFEPRGHYGEGRLGDALVVLADGVPFEGGAVKVVDELVEVVVGVPADHKAVYDKVVVAIDDQNVEVILNVLVNVLATVALDTGNGGRVAACLETAVAVRTSTRRGAAS